MRVYDLGVMEAFAQPHREQGQWQVCSLCRRLVPADLITRHHLTPREKGGAAEDRTGLCRPCHKQLHAIFSNAELAKLYDSIESLRKASKLQPFLKWIRKQKPDRVFRTISAKDKPRRGRGRSAR